jgi:ABC-2 type transport system permease protein
MRSGLVLLAHSLKRARALVLVMGVLLAGFQIFLTLVARSLHQSKAFDQISALVPPFVRQVMGPSFAGLMSFAGIISIGYFHIAIIGSLIGLTISLATLPASEIETKFMDSILSRPLARHWIITRTIALVTICTIVVVGFMTLGPWVGLATLAPADAEKPSADLVLSLAVNLGALMLCWGGVGLAISSASRRRTVAGALTGFLALATFLLDYIARAWSPAATVGWVSPFRYFNALDIVMGFEVPAHHLWVLIGIALAGFAAAYVSFSRRDI